MHPSFKSELQATREEQGGEVFYRVADPETRSSFRLYEVEYLIARALDGRRSFADVVAAMKAEHHVDIEEPELAKFVAQLDSMGFVRRSGQVPLTEPALALGAMPADGGERRRLLTNAFMQLRQGLTVHARDYLRAARELMPDDPALMRLISAVELAGDRPEPAALAAIWGHCRALAADVADSLGPLAPPASPTADAAVAAAAVRSGRAVRLNTRARLILAGAIVGALALGAGGTIYAAHAFHLFVPPVPVRTLSLAGARLPIFVAGAARWVRPPVPTPAAFPAAGVVATVDVRTGVRVAAGERLATQVPPAPLLEGLFEARVALSQADAILTRMGRGPGRRAPGRPALVAQGTALAARLAGLGGQAARLPPPAQRQVQARLRRRLTELTHRRGAAARTPLGRAQLAQGQASRLLDQMEPQLAPYLLLAPIAGEVTAIAARAGQSLAAGAAAVSVRPAERAEVAFAVPARLAPAAGAAAEVSAQRGAPLAGVVVRRDGGEAPAGVAAAGTGAGTAAAAPAEGEGAKAAGEGEGEGAGAGVAAASADPAVEVVVAVPDPTGDLAALPADAFRLVGGYAEPAFRVRPTSLVGDEAHAQVLVVDGNAVSRQPVEVLSTLEGDVVIRDPAGRLRSEMRVVLDRFDGRPLAELADGAEVKAAAPRP